MLQGKDFINNTNYPADDNGHGTHVAGLLQRQLQIITMGLQVQGGKAK